MRVSHLSNLFLAVPLLLCVASPASAAPPQLDALFPPGGPAGKITSLTLTGANLRGLRSLRTSIPNARCEVAAEDRVSLSIPPTTPPGLYDVWAVGPTGISGARAFVVSHRSEAVEPPASNATPVVALNSIWNGRLEKAADTDEVRFQAAAGQRVLLEVWAERIDSRLRAVLEVTDARGKTLATNRGYFGIDPLLDFRAPALGDYTVRVRDLTGGGGPEYTYRLSLDTGPRVAFTVPSVVPRGKASRVTLFGWNLPGKSSASTPGAGLDQMEVVIPAARARAEWPLPLRLHGSQAPLEGFAYRAPSSDVPVFIGVTDLPVRRGPISNTSAAHAEAVPVPAEISGRLSAADQVDWFALTVRRGEVLHFDVLGQRLGAPIDPQLAVLDSTGTKELARFGDEIRNLGGNAVPTAHADPSGRWVAPRDGRFLLTVRDVTAGASGDPRRVYRLRIRREEPDFDLLALPRRDDPSGLNVARGGSEAFDVIALRRGGMDQAIRVTARGLPPGVECADAWLGPGVDRVTMTLRVDRGAAVGVGELALEGLAEGVGRRPVRATAVVRAGYPTGWGRLVSGMPFAVAEESPLRIHAEGHEPMQHQLYGQLRPRHAPGSVLDVAVRIERDAAAPKGPVRLLPLGLPDGITAHPAMLPAGATSGTLSFFLPPGMRLGTYSLVVRADTVSADGLRRADSVTACSDPISFTVEAAAFRVEVDPFVPARVRREETIQITYGVKRLNGFIGKVHTELAAPGVITDVPGLRARGETFVGQTDRGSLQLTVNPDAPLGRQRFLRLFSVGVVEDEPLFQGADFLELEVVE